MKFFDLHSDTITECFKNSEELYENQRQISLNKAACYDLYVQVFAIWVEDDYKGDPYKYFCEVCSYAKNQFNINKDFMLFCQTANDLKKAAGTGKSAAILSVENARALQGSIRNLDDMFRKGVRLITLCWNGANELGYGAVTANKGLTDFGKQVVLQCEQKGIVVDVSHLSERGFYDVAELMTKPFIASHSNAKKICDHPRNLTDEQIAVIRDRNGLIGINLHMPFLSAGTAALDDIYRHLSHFLELGCENVIAFGSDFDGGTMSPVWDSIDKVETVCEYLYQRGLDDTLLNNLNYQNAFQFFKRNL